jgi:preprotein translocase subunit SecG
MIPGLGSFLGTYFLAEKTKTMEKSQKQNFLIKFAVFLACVFVTVWLLDHIINYM